MNVLSSFYIQTVIGITQVNCRNRFEVGGCVGVQKKVNRRIFITFHCKRSTESRERQRRQLDLRSL